MACKIGILTFHASHNYGSMLQAYALQTFLQRQGFEVKIVNYRSFAQRALYPKPKRVNVGEWLKNPKLFIQNRLKWEKFEGFMNQHYSLTKICFNLSQIESVIKDEEFDILISGGDQIWNMNCMDFSIAYYLPFDSPVICKIAYSPSFGGMNYWDPIHYGSVLKDLLKHYDFVSVREKEAARFLTELLGQDVPYVADPTFLLEAKDYEIMAGEKPIVEGSYIYYYSPWPNSMVDHWVSNYADYYGLKVVVSNGNAKGNINGCVQMNACGPIEFLNLVKFSTAVIGESLHLALFSMYMHKQFYVVSKMKEFRMGGLLELAGLLDRYFLACQEIPKNQQEIDWEKIDSFVKKERNNAARFLNKSGVICNSF